MTPRARRYDESDVRIRPNRRGTRPRTKDRPAHEDAVPGFVTAVDRGRYTLLVHEGGERVVTAMKARELGRKSVVVGDEAGLVGDASGGPDALARIVRVEPRTDRCCGVPPTTPTRSSGSSSPTPTSSSS